MIVCSCKGVTRKQVERARDAGAATVEEIGRACGAGTGCGGCRHTLRVILAGAEVAHTPHATCPQPALAGA